MGPVPRVQGGAGKQDNSVKGYTTEITQVNPHAKQEGLLAQLKASPTNPGMGCGPYWARSVPHKFTVSSKKLVSPSLALIYLLPGARALSSLELGRRQEVELQKKDNKDRVTQG